MASRRRIVIAGAGIAGSLVTAGLMDEDVDLHCFERVGLDDHAEAGTGLNIGPNALKCLAAYLPASAAMMIENSLPWKRWTIAETNGSPLMDLGLLDVADNPGIRIRWAELYDLLRAPIAPRVTFGAEVTGCARAPDGRLSVTWIDHKTGETQMLADVDLLIAAEGRYSAVRTQFFGSEAPNFLGVCLYRLLYPAGADCPIDDYGQWFNGPNRLLAFRVPGDFVYCAGSFPIPVNAPVPDAMKTSAALRAAYVPKRGRLSEQASYLVEQIERHVERIHWARLQEGSIRYGQAGEPVLLLGDAAHPMVPTLGQGATQSIEDACVAVDEIRAALRAGDELSAIPARVAARRMERIRFVVDFSREATDTMLAGADPVAGTLAKTQKPFQDKLKRLYCDVALPA